MGGPQTAPGRGVADAAPGNFVDRHAPAWARPYLRLSRADRPIGTWLLLIPCLWGLALAILEGGGPRPFDAWIAGGCAVGAFLMRGAGCTWNDVTDRDIDAGVARTRGRPLPAGEVTVRAALVWMGAQALLAFGILLTFHPLAIALGAASLALVAVYPFAKRFTWWPQAFLGLAFNWGALLAYAAHAGTLTWAPVLAYGAGIAWTLFYDTIYAHQDAEDDALIGVRSTARLFGAQSRRWLLGFLVAAAALMAAAGIAAAWDARDPLVLLLALAAGWGLGLHMTWMLGRADLGDPASCLRAFRSTKGGGLVAAAALAAAALAASR